MQWKYVGRVNTGLGVFNSLLGKVNQSEWGGYAAGTCLVSRINTTCLETGVYVEVFVIIYQRWENKIERGSFDILNVLTGMLV